jgi:hypothetical protein
MWKFGGSTFGNRPVKTMTRLTIPLHAYIEAANVFHWATKRHYQLWFTGQAKTRHRRTESVLKRLTRSGKLRAVYYGKKLIYSVPRKSKGMKQDEFAGLSKVVHGLACTECLVRFFRSRTDGTVVAERFFSTLGAVPEWGIVYPNGTMLLFEFCTRDNFFFSGKLTGKMAAYRNNLERIEESFNAKAVVVFVVDVKREILDRFVKARVTDPGPYFFSDYETFLKMPIGRALYEPIYTWSFDAKLYPLSRNV